MLDLNLAVISGRLAAPVEVRQFDSGIQMLRILVTTRTQTDDGAQDGTNPRQRVDVLPVALWEPPEGLADSLEVGDRVWVAGTIQRRFWSDPQGRRSRLEVVATQITKRGSQAA